MTSLLLVQLWQVTLVAAVALLIAKAFRDRPHVVTALWLVVLVKAVTPPVWSSPVGVFSRWTSSVSEAGTAVGTEDVESVPRTNPGLEATRTSRDDDAPRNETDPLDPAIAANVLLGHAPDRGIARHEETEAVVVSSPRGDVDPVESATVSSPPASASPSGRLAGGLVVVWLAGLLVLVVRALLGWSRVVAALRDRVDPSGELTATFDGVRERLGLRGAVRLVVTRRGLGPAVVGCLRPVVVLPEVVVAGRSAEELEPILVHELLHVRRGDTWTGALQLVVGAVWWFHPLVVWVNRELTRDVERCCDAESIAALGGSPAEYARSLLDVLELKRELRTPSALPGMRPMDVTTNRLERIMRTNGPPTAYARWATRFLLLALVAIVLPGAGTGTADEPGAPDDATPMPPRTPSEEPVGPSVGQATIDGGGAVAAADAQVRPRTTKITEGGLPFLYEESFENGERVVRSGWPVPFEHRESPASDEKPMNAVIRLEAGGVAFRVQETPGRPLRREQRIEADGERGEIVTAIDDARGADVAIEFVGFAGARVRGHARRIVIRREAVDGLESGRLQSISFERVRLEFVDPQPAGKVSADELVIRWHEPEESSQRVDLSATGSVRIESADSRVTCGTVTLLLRLAEKATPPWAIRRGLLTDDLRIAMRGSGGAWRSVRPKRVLIDEEGRMMFGSPAVLESAPVDAGDDAADDVMGDSIDDTVAEDDPQPPSSRRREPVVGNLPAIRPPAGGDPFSRNNPLVPGRSRTGGTTRERSVVANALLGTAPPPSPPTVDRVLDRWQKVHRVRSPLRVEFLRYRYQRDAGEVAVSRGRFRFEGLLDPDGEPFELRYELDGPAGVDSVGAGLKVVADPPTRIVLSESGLEISRPGPDFERELTAEQAGVLQGLQFLQAGYLVDAVRENFAWRLVIEDSRWIVMGSPRGKPFADHIDEAMILIDPVSETPTAVRMQLQDDAETVHVLQGTQQLGDDRDLPASLESPW